MKAITLRNILEDVRKALRVSLESTTKTPHTDLDELAGSWSAAEGKAFEKTLRSLRRIDRDVWR